MKSVLIAGASGLVGSFVVKYLLADNKSEDKIILLVRKKLDLSGPRIIQIICDFDQLESLNLADYGISEVDAAICTLGSTIKKSGTREAFIKVDHDYVVAFAELSKRYGAKHFAVVSALGAEVNSNFFYNRIKGKMEQSLKRLSFYRLVIVRPSLLIGERNEKRAGENFLIKLSPLLNRTMIGPLKKYRGIEAHKVAAFLTQSLSNKDIAKESGVVIIENDQLLTL